MLGMGQKLMGRGSTSMDRPSQANKDRVLNLGRKGLVTQPADPFGFRLGKNGEGYGAPTTEFYSSTLKIRILRLWSPATIKSRTGVPEVG
ncbi:hypothetical protein V6N12_062755 [Hibiscus sabdariffa]|uniref:Uncharacterized protein n=1 Tax=Hibiscus sabdariffa TaxID=183260 RepID=A0ABR2F9T0_9ROSI